MSEATVSKSGTLLDEWPMGKQEPQQKGLLTSAVFESEVWLGGVSVSQLSWSDPGLRRFRPDRRLYRLSGAVAVFDAVCLGIGKLGGVDLVHPFLAVFLALVAFFMFALATAFRLDYDRTS